VIVLVSMYGMSALPVTDNTKAAKPRMA